ncbi:MAG: transposase [Bacteroidales bacterium]|nr:transposase [Bacteroidales bacterium]MCM1417110.1 transposase [bacterium]
MKKLLEIARDYSTVKKYVYQRYGGIKSLPKLYPGYTVQNEMTAGGLRQELGLPSVYFYLAVFDALGDIKDQWTQTKGRVEKCIRENPNLTPEDRHYLRFVMKQSRCLECILLEKEMDLSEDWQRAFEDVRKGVEEHRLNQYLRRQVRRHFKKMDTDAVNAFTVSERAYRYDDHGIYLAVKEKRKRVFIPLTDNHHYTSQIKICLSPEERNLVIHVPVERKIRKHADYHGEIGIAIGIRAMLVTDGGHVYGERYSEYQYALSEYVRQGNIRYRRNREQNSGRKKYLAGRERLEAALHTYINAEINRMLRTEKPDVIYLPKLPQSSRAGVNKRINSSVNMWQRGYIRNRLTQKCREQSIKLIGVFGKDISNECSRCGTIGKKSKDVFVCKACGAELPERENAAKNALQRGKASSLSS